MSAQEQPLQNNPSSEVDCESVQALIPAYSIGATDADETAFVNANLAKCPDAVADLADYAAMAEAMHHAVPLMQAPASLAVSLSTAARLAKRQKAAPVQMRIVRVVRRRVGLIAAAVAIALLIGSNVYWLSEYSALRSHDQSVVSTLNEQKQLLDVLGSANKTDRVVLASTQPNKTSSAALVCDPQRSMALLRVQGFPSLAPNQSYQLWLSSNGKRISGGLFSVDSNGTGIAVVNAPEPIGNYQIAGITTEPNTGSNGPTSPAIVRGNLYTPDGN